MSFVIAIDGPAGAGKSTTARAVARALGFIYLDTGALYRALALAVKRADVSPDDGDGLDRLAGRTRVSLAGTADHPEVWLDGENVTALIRTPEIGELASRLAVRSVVRSCLIEAQRALRARGPLVGEGRDLGTVVFADAQVKIYLDADLEKRSQRRHLELERRGIIVPFDEVRSELARRDERDRGRTDSPLRVAPGALVLDTSNLSIDEQTVRVLEIARRHPEFPAHGGHGSDATRPG